jgi:hemerythrin
MLWTESLSIGVDLIDQQHKTWFEKAEALFEAGKNRQAKEMSTQRSIFVTRKSLCWK